MQRFKTSLWITLGLFFSLSVTTVSYGQDDLINKVKDNQSVKAKEGFKFTVTKNIECTDVKNQGSSGTCWSYSANSFLESEMIRIGRKPVTLSQIYSARCAYIEKGVNYVRMHGALTLGDGGAFHDVINMYAKYGALPQSLYTGLNYGTAVNKSGEMQEILKGILDAVIKNPNKELTPVWQKAYTRVIDTYLGDVPETFQYEGKTYTPKSFAKDVVGLNADDYVEISSFNNIPFYQRSVLMVPDNWSFDQIYNVKINDLTEIIDYALSQGYSVAWAGDVSEKTFSWKNGLAILPPKPYTDLSDEEKSSLFDAPKSEMDITQEERQRAFDNYNTTDDHGMQITGIAKDQNGKEYYIVKNSWGASNDYKGYLYMSKGFAKYKATAIMLHKGGISKAMKEKMKI